MTSHMYLAHEPRPSKLFFIALLERILTVDFLVVLAVHYPTPILVLVIARQPRTEFLHRFLTRPTGVYLVV